jgi:hypothetical protein
MHNNEIVLDMINAIAKKCRNKKYTFEIIGSVASNMMRRHLIQDNRVYTNKIQSLEITEIKCHDLDIRTCSKESCEYIIDELKNITTTKLLQITNVRQIYYGFVRCVRLDLKLCNYLKYQVDISHCLPHVYCLADFEIQCTVGLGQQCMTPSFVIQKLSSFDTKKAVVNFIFKNNRLLIPKYHTWCSIVAKYINSPNYFDMLYNQIYRWTTKFRRFIPCFATYNKQEYLRNVNHTVIVSSPHSLYAKCPKCSILINMQDIVDNKNAFARCIIVEKDYIALRCPNFCMHDDDTIAEDGEVFDFSCFKHKSDIMYTEQKKFFMQKYKCYICHNSSFDIQLRCGHFYCQECLSAWETVNDRKTCPYCRKPIQLAQNIYGDAVIFIDNVVDHKSSLVDDREELHNFPVNFHCSQTSESQNDDFVDIPLVYYIDC